MCWSPGWRRSNRAYERATQTLIAKLDAGLSDRLDALMHNRPDAQLHPRLRGGDLYPAAVTTHTAPIPSDWIPRPFDLLPAVIKAGVKATDRAQVIAWYDYIKSELPDVFSCRISIRATRSTRSTSGVCNSSEAGSCRWGMP